ncbi:MAG: hypothetical protein AAF333_16880 [Planctomycetota bacterium]
MNIPRFGQQNFRQVHLDFHTTDKLEGIGERFDADQFAKTLQLGHVDAINLFAKCHHSWCYFPTEVGMVHPHLKQGLDLFGEQCRACEAAGIRTTAYITVGWSATEAAQHPEWCVRRKDGSIHSNQSDTPNPPALSGGEDEPYPLFFWKFLCPSGDYRQHVLDLTREVLTKYPTQGIWYDICNLETCWCERCVAGMKERGMDPDNDADAAKYCVDKWEAFLGDCRAIIDELRPADSDKPGSAFFNGLTHMVTPERILQHQTHYELEDLPTVWGGYDKLPPRARFFGGEGKELIAMSGKFHTAWGEFGGYKNPEAIRYEAATMLAFNSRCNFGDQLHPCGELDEQTYRNIGVGFEYVQRFEKYNLGITPDTNLGVVFGVQPKNTAVHGTSSSHEDEGVCVMLLESQIDFEGVELDAPNALEGKDAVIVTQRCLTAEQAERLQAYAEAGGVVVLVGDAALLASQDDLALDIGAEYVGPANYTIDYTHAGEALQKLGDLGTGPYLNYDPAIRLRPTSADVLATIREPYFDRTYGHYTSHQHTPYRTEDAEHPAALKHGNVVVITHPLGRMYAEHGARQHRELLTAVLAHAGFRPTLDVAEFGSSGRATMYEQPSENRRVIHLTYGTPTKRGECEVIEDLPTLRGVKLSVAAEGVSSATLVNTGESLPVNVVAGRAEVTVPEMRCHALVTLQ